MFTIIPFFALSILVSSARGQSSTVEDLCPASLTTQDHYYLQVWEDSCLWFVTNVAKRYRDAQLECREHGGRLVRPKTPEFNDFLADELENTYSAGITWIGLHDTVNEGDFIWSDNTTLEWDNFARLNGPNNFFFWGAAEDCVAIQPWDGFWHDFNCYSYDSPKPFVCQFTAQPSGSDDVAGKDNNANSTEGGAGDGAGETTGDVAGNFTGDPSGGSSDDVSDSTTTSDGAGAGPGEDSEDGPGEALDNGPGETSEDGPGETSEDGPGETSEDGPDETSEDGPDELEDDCGTFDCTLDCGMDGYVVDENDCQICECWSPDSK